MGEPSLVITHYITVCTVYPILRRCTMSLFTVEAKPRITCLPDFRYQHSARPSLHLQGSLTVQNSQELHQVRRVSWAWRVKSVKLPFKIQKAFELKHLAEGKWLSPLPRHLSRRWQDACCGDSYRGYHHVCTYRIFVWFPLTPNNCRFCCGFLIRGAEGQCWDAPVHWGLAE